MASSFHPRAALLASSPPHLVVRPGLSDASLLFFLANPLRHQHEVQHPLGRRSCPGPLLRIVVAAASRLLCGDAVSCDVCEQIACPQEVVQCARMRQQTGISPDSAGLCNKFFFFVSPGFSMTFCEQQLNSHPGSSSTECDALTVRSLPRPGKLPTERQPVVAGKN